MENPILDQEVNQVEHIVYAGFWTRTGASLIDGLIFLPATIIGFVDMMHWKNLALMIFLSSLWLIYKIYMEGKYGATLGKRYMGIKVVNDQYQPITMEQAIIRASIYILNYLGAVIFTVIVFNSAGFSDITSFMDMNKFSSDHGQMLENATSLIVMISILFVAFDPKKQALHDKIAKTYVIKVS